MIKRKMRTLMILALSLAVFLSMPVYGFAQQKKKLNLDAENIKKATQVINQNKALFQNPELLEKFQRLSMNLKKKNG